MQYLVSVIDDTAGLATPDEMAAIDASMHSPRQIRAFTVKRAMHEIR